MKLHVDAPPGDAHRSLPDRPPPARVDLGRQRLAERLERVENPDSDRAGLQDRLSELPPGHPSSPWDEHGTPRPPVPRLADLEQLSPPLSDAAYAGHVSDVVKGLGDAGAEHLANADQHTVDGNREHWTAERNKIHAAIVAEVYALAADVPCERHAIIAGGLAGAGKTTVLEKYAGIDLSRYVMINPDNLKEKLAERGLTKEIPGLSPMETTTLAHEESSDIARRLALLAMADGKNIIWDITLSSEKSSRRVDELRAAGYRHIEGIFVDIPIETSIARSEARHRDGHDRYLAGDGLGGRYVPPEVIKMQWDEDFGTKNRRIFETIKGRLDNWMIYDNSLDGRPPVLVDRKSVDHDQADVWQREEYER
jgi:predicted ABC-type ATPase